MSLSVRPQRRVLVTKINRSQSFAGVNSSADRPFRYEMGAHAACHEEWGQAWALWWDLLCLLRLLPIQLSQHLPQGSFW